MGYVINGRPLYILTGCIHALAGDVHYIGAGTLKLINVLINPAKWPLAIQQMEGLLSNIRSARRLLWLASAGDSQLLPGTGGEKIFPGAGQRIIPRYGSLPAGDHHSQPSRKPNGSTRYNCRNYFLAPGALF